MTQMVKFLHEERNTRFQGESSNPPKGDKSSKGDGGDGDKTPKRNGGNCEKPPLTAPFSSTKSPSKSPPHSPKGHGKTPFLKLHIKFDFPMYGELNSKRLDNWVHHLEVYFRIQITEDDDTKIQLASLRLESVTLI